MKKTISVVISFPIKVNCIPDKVKGSHPEILTVPKFDSNFVTKPFIKMNTSERLKAASFKASTNVTREYKLQEIGDKTGEGFFQGDKYVRIIYDFSSMKRKKRKKIWKCLKNDGRHNFEWFMDPLFTSPEFWQTVRLIRLYNVPIRHQIQNKPPKFRIAKVVDGLSSKSCWRAGSDGLLNP